MHGDIGNAVFRGDGEHRRVELPGGNIVDNQRSERPEGLCGHVAAECIDRNRHIRSQPPHGLHPQRHAPPLLVGRDLVGAGARGVAAHINQLRTFGHGIPDAVFDGVAIGHTAIGIERIGRDVQNRHHLRCGKINLQRLHG